MPKGTALDKNGRLKNRPAMNDTNLLLTITIVAFFVMYIGAIVFLGGSFKKPQNFMNILNNNASLIVLACGMSIVMITGGIESGKAYTIIKTLLVLTYSAFCLTSLDTATRLGRFMFAEFWIDSTKGETYENVSGVKKFLANPYVATIITVILGIMLGLNGYAKIWALFGSANQLLAALALLCIATWLGNIGKKNANIVIPMFFMLAVTIASLIINTKSQIATIMAGGADWGPWVQAIVGALLVVLAVVLTIEGIVTIANQKKAKKA